MKKIFAIVISVALVLCLFVGCAEKSQEPQESNVDTSLVSSAPPKDEVELVLEQTLWQLEGQSSFLLFHDGKRVSEYDLSTIDEVNQEIEKSLTYSVEINDKGEKAIFFPYLMGKQNFRLTYEAKTKSFVNADDSKISLKQVSMESFVEEFMKQIENAGKDKEWESQAEMNVAAGVRCNYWDTLYQAIDRYLKATLSAEEYEAFETQTKTFETARKAAVDDAGKEVEGGSLYPVVTGGAYCTQTEKEIQNILTKYFS